MLKKILSENSSTGIHVLAKLKIHQTLQGHFQVERHKLDSNWHRKAREEIKDIVGRGRRKVLQHQVDLAIFDEAAHVRLPAGLVCGVYHRVPGPLAA